MTMPRDLLFIRHGQSEANIVQKTDEHGIDPEIAQALFDRPDWQHRLSEKGIEQAKMARAVIEREFGGLESFDALYVSPFIRTRETAEHLGGVALSGWTVDDRIVGRTRRRSALYHTQYGDGGIYTGESG